jgi:hypothetical protein
MQRHSGAGLCGREPGIHNHDRSSKSMKPKIMSCFCSYEVRLSFAALTRPE